MCKYWVSRMTHFFEIYEHEDCDVTYKFSADDDQAFRELEAFTRLAAEGSSATKARCAQLRRVVPH